MPEEGASMPIEVSPPPPDFGDPKMWFQSKELWVAIVAVACFTFQAKFGWLLFPPELQGSVVVLIMAILRSFFTSAPIAWSKKHLARLKNAIV